MAPQFTCLSMWVVLAILSTIRKSAKGARVLTQESGEDIFPWSTGNNEKDEEQLPAVRNCTHSSKRSAMTSWSGLKNMCNWFTELCQVNTDEQGDIPTNAPGVCVKKEGTWVKSSCVAVGSKCKMGIQNTNSFSCCPGMVCAGGSASSPNLGFCVPKADTEQDGYSYLAAGSPCDVSVLSGTSLEWKIPCRDGFYCRVSGSQSVCRSKEDDDLSELNETACYTKGNVKLIPAVPCCPEPGNILKMKMYCGCKNNFGGDCKETADCCSNGLKCSKSKCVKLEIGDPCTKNSQCDFPHGSCGTDGKCFDIRNFRCKNFRCGGIKGVLHPTVLLGLGDPVCNDCPGKNYYCNYKRGMNIFQAVWKHIETRGTEKGWCEPA